MFLSIDAWYDWWRILLILLFTFSISILLGRVIRNRKRWNEEKNDLWFVLFMWSLAAWEMQLEALLRDTPLRFRLVFITASGLITLKLLLKRDHEKLPSNLQ